MLFQRMSLILDNLQVRTLLLHVNILSPSLRVLLKRPCFDLSFKLEGQESDGERMLCSRYGVYLHCGYEHQFISPHNGVINTSFQHYAHHARSPVCGPFIRQQSGNTCKRSHVKLCLKHFFMKADSSDWIFFKKNALCKLKFCKLKFCFCNLIPTQPSSIQC